MKTKVILLGMLMAILVLANLQSACSVLYWQVDSEADWYEGHMIYTACNDTDALHFTGEKVLFEDGFTWTTEDDSPWLITKIDKNRDGNMNMILDCSQESVIRFISTANESNDKIRLELWERDSPIDVNYHTYEVLWKARLDVDQGYNVWEIWVGQDGRDRILYDLGGEKVKNYRDQISARKDGVRNNVKFEHYGEMESSHWNTGKIYFGQGSFLAYNDRYGDDDQSDGDINGFYMEADNSQAYRELGCLTTTNPPIRIMTNEQGHTEEFWLDYFKVIQVDETVPEGFYISNIWDSGDRRNWDEWYEVIKGVGDYDIDFGTGNGVFYNQLADVPESTTLQFKIIMRGNTVIDSVRIAPSR